jgi:hypothetical protein
MMSVLPKGLETLEQNIPYDVVNELRNSRFGQLAKFSEAEMIKSYKLSLESFVCPLTQMKF